MQKATVSEAPTKLNSAIVVDDHPLFCDALTMTLRLTVGIADVRTAGSLDDALAHLETGTRPDVIVLDLNLPDVNGLDGLVRLKTAAGPVPVVVVSSMTDARMVNSVLRAGAQGFVPKHSQREIFRDAFDAISAGRIYTPAGFVPITDDTQPATESEVALHRLSLLTPQQARILQLLCEGKLNKQIAYELSIAETTVKAHVTAIMRKLGVQSRTQAVLLAQQVNFASVLQEGEDKG
ncbi:MAG: response regulator transcription factor [Rhodobacteraceae bacterium]|nr:response regulator transcription factor [Paracoccaceae bacterium]